MLEIEVKRHIDQDDLASLSPLLAAVAEADSHPALGEHAWLDLVQGGRAGFAGLVAWEAGRPHPVGYAQLSRGDTVGVGDYSHHGHGLPSSNWALELVTDPHHRARGNTVAADLLASAIDLVAREGGGHLHLWVNQPDQAHDRLAANAGLSPGRALYQMRRPLPADRQASIKTRAFRVGLDENAWLLVNNRAFAWHPEQGGWTADTLKAREAQPWFDPEGFLLHESAQPGEKVRLAGFCWTKVHEEGSSPVGEIYVVAVDPDFAGRGLGRELTLAGLGYMWEKRIARAMLYVDSTNAKAVKMYAGLGFVIDHIDRAYTGDVPPAA